jgi:Gas vesicle synthesis protein GvpL/GvpF
MSLYVYCVADPASARAAAGAKGLGGAEVGVLERGGLAAVVSEFGEAVARVTRENVLAHERVVETVLGVETPLPFRFGTVVGRERLTSYLDSQAGPLGARLAWVRGCVEMSVKVMVAACDSGNEAQRAGDSTGVTGHDGAQSDSQSEARPGELGEASRGDSAGRESGGASMRGLNAAGPGAAFLLAKRREILGDEAARARAEEVAAWLARRLDPVARDSRVAVRARSSLAVSAAHLVERARLCEYRERVGAARAERAGLRFLTSGAWPPYSFVVPEPLSGAAQRE